MDANIQSEMKQKMDKTIESLRSEFVKLRTGRASPAILDSVRVDSYGSIMALNQVAGIGISDSRTIVITPWDKSLLQAIEKGIHKAEIGLQPMNDGKVVRISIPALTEERRKELVKVAKRIAEEWRVSARNTRRETNEIVKKLQKDSKITEDDLKKSEVEIQKMTDQYVAQIDQILANKEKEIMEV